MPEGAGCVAKLDFADLTGINSLAGIGVLKQALSVWEQNKGNDDEGFWQAKLREFSFVFSQVFSSPVVVFGTKAYVGGKSLDGSGGKEPDFLLKNELTSHVLIVEIKTPATELLGRSPYRPPDVFAASREACGAVGQIARYKDEFLSNYGNLLKNSDEKFLLADPRCLVVVGNTGQLDGKAKKDSFEHFRRGLRGTEVITFDELFRKVQVLLALLEGEGVAPVGEMEVAGDEEHPIPDRGRHRTGGRGQQDHLPRLQRRRRLGQGVRPRPFQAVAAAGSRLPAVVSGPGEQRLRPRGRPIRAGRTRDVGGEHDRPARAEACRREAPIRYDAVETALSRVADEAARLKASVHMPRIGCGLAGGTWDRIEPIIHRTLCGRGVEVLVYDLG